MNTIEKRKPISPLENPRREKFCRLYVTDRNFFGNGVKCYMEAYENSNYNSAKNAAKQLLQNITITNRISELLDVELNDITVDKQLAFVILQCVDFSAKVRAIAEYNKIKGRIAKRSGIQPNLKQIVGMRIIDESKPIGEIKFEEQSNDGSAQHQP